MVTRLTQAGIEAYATPRKDEPRFHVVSVDCLAFDGPAQFLMGSHDDVTVTFEDGTEVTFTGDPDSTSRNRLAPFDFVPPGSSDTGPTPAKLTVESISGKVYPILREAIGSGMEVTVAYRCFRAADPSEPIDVITDLKMKSVTLSPTSASGDLAFEEVATQAFPRRTYDLENYPGLWRPN